MSSAQLHLLLNHLPVIIPLIGVPIVALGFSMRSLEIQKVGMMVLVAAALVTIPTYLTGDPAEDQIKNYPGVTRWQIHEHEKSAKFALIAIEIMGAVTLLLYWRARGGKTEKTLLHLAFLALWCLVFVIMARTAHLGGKIRHEEIRADELSSGSP